MTLSEIYEVNVIDDKITLLHNELRELYERRAEIMSPRQQDDTHPVIDAVNLTEIDLSLPANDTALAIAKS